MNSAVGTIYESSTALGGTDPRPVGSPVGGGWLPGNNYNNSQTTWLTYGKTSSFTRPGPSDTWVLMDENPYSINDGSMAISAVASTGNTFLIDYPAGNHGFAAGISFADGHSIVHKWTDSRTYTPQGVIQPGMGSTSPSNQKSIAPFTDNADCFYLASITSAAH